MYRLQIVESIPDGLLYPNVNDTQFLSTFEAWQTLLNLTKSTINIASFYWTMLGIDVGNDTYSSAEKGETIFKKLQTLAKNGIVTIRIAKDISHEYPKNDIELLKRNHYVKVRELDFSRLWGSGVLHTKLWLVDEKHFYLGSANMDWRALSEVSSEIRKNSKNLLFIVQNYLYFYR